MDVTPREAPPVRRSRSYIGWVIGLVLVAAMGGLVYKGLTEATVFFLNADEAVERRDDLGDDRFRLQGTVVPGTIRSSGDELEFTVTYAGVDVDVRHRGDPEELLSPDTPVVLEGSWVGNRFESDLLLNKHDEVYEEENPDHLEYDPDAPPQS